MGRKDKRASVLVYTFICDGEDGAGFLESETKGKNGLEIYER